MLAARTSPSVIRLPPGIWPDGKLKSVALCFAQDGTVVVLSKDSTLWRYDQTLTEEPVLIAELGSRLVPLDDSDLFGEEVYMNALSCATAALDLIVISANAKDSTAFKNFILTVQFGTAKVFDLGQTLKVDGKIILASLETLRDVVRVLVERKSENSTDLLLFDFSLDSFSIVQSFVINNWPGLQVVGFIKDANNNEIIITESGDFFAKDSFEPIASVPFMIQQVHMTDETLFILTKDGLIVSAPLGQISISGSVRHSLVEVQYIDRVDTVFIPRSFAKFCQTKAGTTIFYFGNNGYMYNHSVAPAQNSYRENTEIHTNFLLSCLEEKQKDYKRELDLNRTLWRKLELIAPLSRIGDSSISVVKWIANSQGPLDARPLAAWSVFLRAEVDFREIIPLANFDLKFWIQQSEVPGMDSSCPIRCVDIKWDSKRQPKLIVDLPLKPTEIGLIMVNVDISCEFDGDILTMPLDRRKFDILDFIQPLPGPKDKVNRDEIMYFSLESLQSISHISDQDMDIENVSHEIGFMLSAKDEHLKRYFQKTLAILLGDGKSSEELQKIIIDAENAVFLAPFDIRPIKCKLCKSRTPSGLKVVLTIDHPSKRISKEFETAFRRRLELLSGNDDFILTHDVFHLF